MQTDAMENLGHRPYPLRKLPVGAAGHLRKQLDRLSQGHAKVLRHSEKAWASITFEGSRHTLELLFDGGEAVAAGESFIAALPEHEFAVPGQLVADATVTGLSTCCCPSRGRMRAAVVARRLTNFVIRAKAGISSTQVVLCLTRPLLSQGSTVGGRGASRRSRGG